MLKRKGAMERLLARGLIHCVDPEGDGGGSAGAAEAAAAAEAAVAEAAAAAAEVAATEEALRVATEKAGASGQVTEEMAKLLRDVMKQKGRAKEAEGKIGKLSTELEALKSVLGDTDPASVKKMVDAVKEAQRKELEEKGKYEQIVAQMREEHKAGVKSLEEKNAELMEQFGNAQSQVMELTVGRAFAESAFIRDSSVLPPAIARREFGAYFELEGDQVVAFNKPKGAQGRAPLVDANGVGKSFEDAIAALYAQHSDAKSLLRTKQKPGAGSSTAASGKPAASGGSEGEQLSGRERIRAALNGARK